MYAVSEKGVVSSRDLDFLACSFARMHLHGRHLCTDAITGNMDEGHCCKVSDEAAFCLIQRPYISKTLLTRRISPRGSP
ncbi:glycogen synthase [Leclercia adecarboxylata]|uniref:glycogen synthase n=1 Tax=Leclercia adecarboxylata TaxID=83655 RepID=UPI00111A9D58|nr:glycogen synthase [Leclercia adecarboxylata]QCZ30321.1 glycogen synthase [Leclercia adecarboxylata]